jgi:hypothetical protein
VGLGRAVCTLDMSGVFVPESGWPWEAGGVAGVELRFGGFWYESRGRSPVIDGSVFIFRKGRYVEVYPVHAAQVAYSCRAATFRCCGATNRN